MKCDHTHEPIALYESRVGPNAVLVMRWMEHQGSWATFCRNRQAGQPGEIRCRVCDKLWGPLQKALVLASGGCVEPVWDKIAQRYALKDVTHATS